MKIFYHYWHTRELHDLFFILHYSFYSFLFSCMEIEVGWLREGTHIRAGIRGREGADAEAKHLNSFLRIKRHLKAKYRGREGADTEAEISTSISTFLFSEFLYLSYLLR